MHQEKIREGLLVSLAATYEQDPSRYIVLSKQTLDSALAREVVAELKRCLDEQLVPKQLPTPSDYSYNDTSTNMLCRARIYGHVINHFRFPIATAKPRFCMCKFGQPTKVSL